MKKYIKIMRIDHWIKQLFILPGVAFAMLLVPDPAEELPLRILLGFLSTCFIASANYVINEWLDAAFDRFHPVLLCIRQQHSRTKITAEHSLRHAPPLPQSFVQIFLLFPWSPDRDHLLPYSICQRNN